MREASRSGFAQHRGGRVRRLAAALAAAVLAVGMALTGSLATAGAASAAPSAAAAASLCPDANVAAFGPNVCVFTPSMSQAAIQADLNAVATQQVPVASQFDSDRYALFFEPGTYGSAAAPLVFQVGYYTEVAGLGSMPQDTVIDGAIDVFNNLCTPSTTDCNADDNFWRSMSNLTLNVDLPSSPPAYAPPTLDPYGAGCDNSAELWGASQAAPIRRAIINGNLVVQDYCAAKNYASGGFIADSEISGDFDSYGNQQYLVRNSEIGGANGCAPDNGGLWNNVYSGVTGAPAAAFGGQCDQNTVLASSPVTEEEPFLYTNSGGAEVFVPAVQHNTSGPSWAGGSEAGRSIPLSRFFIASPGTPVLAIDAALALGKNLILEPGVYDLNSPILVSRPGTVVLGLGFATLVPQRGNAALVVAANTGVKVSGLIVDAGPVNSPVLMSVGVPGFGLGTAADPDTIQDVFFRIGGAETTPVSARRSACWITPSTRSSMTCGRGGPTTAAMSAGRRTPRPPECGDRERRHRVRPGRRALSEDRGRLDRPGRDDVFFQNELPYDPPSQADWMASPAQDGYPAFRVDPERADLQRLRPGQLRRLHRHLGDVVRRRGFRVTRHARRSVPQHLRAVDRRLWR